MQFLLNLSDRQAAEAVRCRIDFKYALAMDLDAPGFRHSVLTDFRDRLGEDDRADQLLSPALDRMHNAGMIKERGRQRTDSTQVLAAVRELTHAELVLEAVRAALEEASRNTPGVLDDLVDAGQATRYGRPVRLPSQPSHPVTRLKQAGADAHQLLQRLPPHRRRSRAEALRQIMVQNFLIDACGLLRPRTEKDGRPKGAVRIISPYDPDARQAIRGNTRWSGYLVHVIETCDADAQVNLITDIATTSPTRDTQALPSIHTRLRSRRLLPAQHPADGGCISTALLNDSARNHQIQLVGPVKTSGAWQKKEQTGFTRDDFTIDFDRRQVTCPNGQTSRTWVEAPAMAPYTAARFASSQCAPCPDRPACTRGKSARTVNFLPRHLHELQARNRTDQQVLQWKRLYATRSGVEGTICESRGLTWECWWRQGKRVGKLKTPDRVAHGFLVPWSKGRGAAGRLRPGGQSLSQQVRQCSYARAATVSGGGGVEFFGPAGEVVFAGGEQLDLIGDRAG